MNESFVTVVGSVVADPVSRPTTSGRPGASLQVASTTRRWDADRRTFVDGNTNVVVVAAFDALAGNVLSSVRGGHPVIVYGRLRVTQWLTPQGEARTSAEVDAYSIGHDLTRGQVEFSPPSRPPAVDGPGGPDAEPEQQERAEHRGPDRAEHRGPDPAQHRGPDPAQHRGPDPAQHRGPDEAEPRADHAAASEPTGFGRRVEDADTDAYVVVPA